MFRGSGYETHRCPYKQITRTPEAWGVNDLFEHTGGKLGSLVLSIGAPMVAAYNMVMQGRAWSKAQDG